MHACLCFISLGLTFGAGINQRWEKVCLRNTLQCLTFGAVFNQSLEKVSLPNVLQSLTSLIYNQSLEKVFLPDRLQSLMFALRSVRVWRNSSEE